MLLDNLERRAQNLESADALEALIGQDHIPENERIGTGSSGRGNFEGNVNQHAIGGRGCCGAFARGSIVKDSCIIIRTVGGDEGIRSEEIAGPKAPGLQGFPGEYHFELGAADAPIGQAHHDLKSDFLTGPSALKAGRNIDGVGGRG